MKSALALLALVASCTAVKVQNFAMSDLDRHLEDFARLSRLPFISKYLIDEYMSKDEKFQEINEYVQSEEFKQLIIHMEAIPELHVAMEYLHNAGINIYEQINAMNDLFGIDRIKPQKSDNYKISGGGLEGFVKDMLRLLPLHKIKALREKKLATSKEYAGFIKQLKSDDFRRIANAVYRNLEYQKISKKLREAGINIDLLKDLIKVIYGIKIPDSVL